MSPRHLLRQAISFMLAFALCFAQQAALAHAISHFSEHTESEKNSHNSSEKFCEKCLHFASLEAAPAPVRLTATNALTYSLPTSTVVHSVTPCFFLRYRSRAPPRTTELI